MATENLLTPGEATERLAEHNVRVTVRTVRRWIASGALPSYELPNGRRVVPESALAAMLPLRADFRNGCDPMPREDVA